MTVKEMFEQEKIDLDFVDNNFDGQYWESCLKFLNDNWNENTEYLTDRQANWLSRILDDCVEKRIRGTH